MEYLFWLIVAAFTLFLLGIWIWLVARIWKVSPVGAVLTFLLTVPAFYFVYKYWGDKEHDIREPFFANLAVWLLAGAAALFLPAQQPDHVPLELEVRANPEMERWCREKNDAEYSAVLGTCIAAEPGQRSLGLSGNDDALQALRAYFADNDVELTELEMDQRNPQSQKLAQIPDLIQVRQYEIAGRGVMPTIMMIGECRSIQACTDLAARMQQPGSPMVVASNDKLLFMALTVMGDADKVDQARTVFAQFPPP